MQMERLYMLAGYALGNRIVLRLHLYELDWHSDIAPKSPGYPKEQPEYSHRYQYFEDYPNENFPAGVIVVALVQRCGYGLEDSQVSKKGEI